MAVDYEHTPVTVENKRAVVIGGTSGIGREIALGFAAEGADVIATSRSDEWVGRTADELRALGAETVEVTTDVTDRRSLEALYETAVEALGGVDILVNSSGAVARQGIRDVSEEEWNRVFGVQLDGVYRAIQIFARGMDTGCIINIASLSANLAIPNLTAYSSAKGGLDALTRTTAKELAPDIRVNAIRPGFFLTPQTEDAYGEGTERGRRVNERTPMGRIGTPDELTGATVYLASDAASYTTGEIIRIDGGFTTSAF